MCGQSRNSFSSFGTQKWMSCWLAQGYNKNHCKNRFRLQIPSYVVDTFIGDWLSSLVWSPLRHSIVSPLLQANRQKILNLTKVKQIKKMEVACLVFFNLCCALRGAQSSINLANSIFLSFFFCEILKCAFHSYGFKRLTTFGLWAKEHSIPWITLRSRTALLRLPFKLPCRHLQMTICITFWPPRQVNTLNLLSHK